MIYKRQRILLHLLKELGGDVASTDFQKLLFLYCNEFESTPSYEFVPYQYGAFSFTSYHDRRKLGEKGFLSTESDNWRLSTTCPSFPDLDDGQSNRIVEFVQGTRRLRGRALIRYVYERYPFYAIHSTILEELGLEPRTLGLIQAARPQPKFRPLFTVGYEGLTLESFLTKLLNARVTLLCDVRKNPLSRKYGFSKRSLQNACEKVGIRYQHIPNLGIESSERSGLTSRQEFETLFERYSRDILPNRKRDIAQIGTWARTENNSVALVCFERRHTDCHRQCVAEELVRSFGSTLEPVHL